MLVHSSLADLQQRGLFEQYCALIDPQALASINELIGPGWMPVELAIDHYTARDKLGLGRDEVYAAGVRAGGKMGEALLVAGSQLGAHVERSPWTIVNAFSRLGRRLYEGGSSQFVKLAENKLLIEYRGNPLFALGYYRTAHTGFMHQTFASAGLELTAFSLSPYRREAGTNRSPNELVMMGTELPRHAVAWRWCTRRSTASVVPRLR